MPIPDERCEKFNKYLSNSFENQMTKSTENGIFEIFFPEKSINGKELYEFQNG